MLTRPLHSDKAGSELIATVTKGLNEVEDAVVVLFGDIAAGKPADQNAETQVGDGLTLAFNAAGNITSYVATLHTNSGCSHGGCL